MSIDKSLTRPLVDLLKQRNKLADDRIEAAFAEVPRHIFIPDADPNTIYTDNSIVLQLDDEGEALSSSIMPSMLAQMLDQLALEPGQNVLEIGAGSGYFAALLRHVLGGNSTVTSVEIDREMVDLASDNLQKLGFRNINIVHSDGANGYAPRASYDRIVSTVGVWDIPDKWIQQLKPKGRLVVPIWLDGLQVIATFIKQDDDTLLSEVNSAGAFVYIRGIAAGPEVSKRVGSTSLRLYADDIKEIDTVALHALLSDDHDFCHLSKVLASEEYWYGALPYIMLSEPEDTVFAVYSVMDNQTAYGISGDGFAVLSAGSACFIPYFGLGSTHCFAGADAFLLVEEILDKWDADGRPGIDRLRLRLHTRVGTRPQITTGKLYERHSHLLHIWLEPKHDEETH